MVLVVIMRETCRRDARAADHLAQLRLMHLVERCLEIVEDDRVGETFE